ncbi:protein YLS9-like protein [Carex littledalei]|uniref:Protein YLS9-like protein n=1 Tax=Carex littledalei TaxID=544730 RepID=A0A833VEN4_9POAL|nr:protein YLS9-like protein [Carex littledalei]
MASNTNQRGCCARCCSGLVSLGFLVLVYWLIFQPHQIRAYVDTATLSNFSLSNTTSAPSLTYNLNLTLSLRNPNRRIGIYFDRLSAAAFYDGSQLGPTESDFDPSFQKAKTTKVVYPAFAGKENNLGGGVGDTFSKEQKEGAYNVLVKLRSKLRYKLWFVKVHFKPKIDCWLRFPLMANGNVSVAAFTKCHVDY